ncbi:hypothetical protein TNIN_305281 [Trichonephila inaurata madagascariensis]|uniref:Uncharacterized protein n=1 Tax=Trichonephila inaurata madagascariensis TaxID=2747483 RepID=A0A8X6YAN2_9ARAC|nr:hypothetical protein TNIN_305281 [Trichonephila inaurata madagascariensis]
MDVFIGRRFTAAALSARDGPESPQDGGALPLSDPTAVLSADRYTVIDLLSLPNHCLGHKAHSLEVAVLDQMSFAERAWMSSSCVGLCPGVHQRATLVLQNGGFVL